MPHMGCQQEKRKSKQLVNLSEKILKENVPNVVKEIDMQVSEAQRVPVMMDAKKPTPRHIIIKRPKAKNKETLTTKKKEVSYQNVARAGGGRGEWVRNSQVEADAQLFL